MTEGHETINAALRQAAFSAGPGDHRAEDAEPGEPSAPAAPRPRLAGGPVAPPPMPVDPHALVNADLRAAVRRRHGGK